jgi:superfamily II DNA or RNA helicase
MMNACLYLSSTAKIQGAPPSVTQAIKERLTFPNPEFEAARKLNKYCYHLPRTISFYQEEPDGLSFPKGFAGAAWNLCRSISALEPELVDDRHELVPINITFTGSLRPYQEKAVNAMLSRTMGVLKSGTGSGKTVIAIALICKIRQPTLVLVPNKELMYQFADRLKAFTDIKEVGLIGDGRFEIQPVTVGIYNSVVRRLEELEYCFGMLVYDECHKSGSGIHGGQILSAFPARYMYGVTATNWRNDGLDGLIYVYLGDLVHTVDDRELRDNGAVLTPEIVFRTTRFTFPYADNYQDLVSAMTADDDRNHQISADVAAETAATRAPILVISNRTDHCDTLRQMIAAKGIACEMVTGKSSSAKRRQAIDRVRAGEVQVLVATTSLLSEGFDLPALSRLFITVSIRFSGLLIQTCGRLLRPSPDGDQPIIYDYVDIEVGVLKAAAKARRTTYQQMGWINPLLNNTN